MTDPLATEPEFDVLITRNVFVEMRDGVRLATDLYGPARAGRPVEKKLPVLLIRTPYNKDDVEATMGYNHWFAQRGYLCIIQDCRGCYRSEGEVNFLFPEAEDGFDTLQWIDAQPWSNGRVGSWGTSWMGWTQTAMAALGPKNLVAMVPNMSGADAHECTVRHAGAMELRFLAWAFWHSAANTQQELKKGRVDRPGPEPRCDQLPRMVTPDADSTRPDSAGDGSDLREVGVRDLHTRRS